MDMEWKGWAVPLERPSNTKFSLVFMTDLQNAGVVSNPHSHYKTWMQAGLSTASEQSRGHIRQ